jgi:hypothetical protein
MTAPPVAGPIDARHRFDVEQWRQERYAALQRGLGWLTLAGLGWLREGANTVGSDAQADVVLPSGLARAGVIEVRGDRSTATGDFTLDGARVGRLPLETEAGGQPTVLELGSLRLCVIERGDRLAVRTWDLAASARRRFRGIDHFPVDAGWRLAGRFEATPERQITVPDVVGIAETKASPGVVVVSIGGHEHRLEALLGGDAGELWLVFGDATNGAETYGGGRFLYTAPPDSDGSVVVDFNRAYNPPCVFSPFATCPLPWPANRIPARVEAGERSTILMDPDPGPSG